ncbi:MAG: ABC transporter substrate-binding protein, partial [Deltaproteobacteria bacterium]|nr:ABC transporter substrate-binding protein [Deltaproteobacteria bacterium]
MAAVGGAAVAWPFAAHAQQAGKVWRIGYLGNTSPETNPDVAHIWAAFQRALRELGYVEGRNLVFEWRYVEGRPERFPAFAAELVRLNVDVIVVLANPGARAAKEATATIPIVALLITDPVTVGLVESLARPGGNMTGISDYTLELVPKRLELLKTAVPAASRVVMIVCDKCAALSPGAAKSAAIRSGWVVAGQALGMTLEYVDISGPQDFEKATAAAMRAHPDAIFLSPNPIIFTLRKEIADFALRQRLPLFAFAREQVVAGSLMSYGPSISDVFRKAAILVDKIFKSEKPGDLPVEQPTKFELVINLKTANALGLTIPQSLLLRADEVI